MTKKCVLQICLEHIFIKRATFKVPSVNPIFRAETLRDVNLGDFGGSWYVRLRHFPFGIPSMHSKFPVFTFAKTFKLPMFAKCDALPKGDLLDMFVSGVHSCHSFGKCNASTPYQKLKVAESASTLCQLCIMLAKDPIPSLQLQEKPVFCREAEGLVTELWSLRFVTMQWLCSQLC